MEPEALKKEKIVKEATEGVVAFFDLFNYPLTAWEIWQFLSVKGDYSEVINVLENKNALISLESKNGFYVLPGRKEIIGIRMSRYNYTDRKFKRAVRLARFFKIIPWIEMIAVGNLIGAHNLKDESDIDLFIIAEKNRLWLTRFFCVLIVKFLGLRPKPDQGRDKICLSFFVSRESLSLKELRLDQADIYFIYWLANLTPIYDKGGAYDEFTETNNWLREYLPNWQAGELNHKRDAGESFSRFYHDLVDMFFGGLENKMKKLELRLMPFKLKMAMNRDKRVVVNDNVLKLHLNDRRAEYQNEFRIKNEELRKKHEFVFKPVSIREIIKEHEARLPKFSDGRIDYSNAESAPVLMAFVMYGEEILIIKRSAKVRAYQGKWNGVGGYLDEVDKSVEKKAQEEIREELGISDDHIKRIRVCGHYKYFDPEIKKTWYINSVLVELKDKPEVKLDWEHTEYKWIRPEDIKNYDIVPNLDVSLQKVLKI